MTHIQNRVVSRRRRKRSSHFSPQARATFCTETSYYSTYADLSYSGLESSFQSIDKKLVFTELQRMLGPYLASYFTTASASLSVTPVERNG